MGHGPWRGWFGAVALLIAAATVNAAQQARNDPPNEYQVKAAFLYNFAKFVEWPAQTFAGPAAPIVIGIAGRDPFGDQLVDTTRGERVNGREISIVHFAPRAPIRGCHVLFIAESDRRRVQEILSQVAGQSVLTVGDTDEFAILGGVIRLAKDDSKIALEINLRAAEQANLKISSRLLSLARIIEPESRRPRP